MLINWKRRIFIGFTFFLCYLDIVSDFLYLFRIRQHIVMIVLLSLQPILYLIYFWLGVITSIIYERNTRNYYYSVFCFCCKAPIFAVLCELKLMLTPLYLLVYDDDTHADRIKHNFLSHVLTHIIFESLPMSIYQGIYTLSQMHHHHNYRIILYMSPGISIFMLIYGIFIVNLIRKMNTGGLNWIQKPKPTLQFYSTLPIPLNRFSG